MFYYFCSTSLQIPADTFTAQISSDDVRTAFIDFKHSKIFSNNKCNKHKVGMQCKYATQFVKVMLNLQVVLYFTSDE